MTRTISPTALTAPAAERNKAAILEVLERVLPAQGTVLEIASGTGQHVAHFAKALPRLDWQPTELDLTMLGSIAAHVARASLQNVASPIRLDVLDEVWTVARADAVLCINMIHIAPSAATPALFAGAAGLLECKSPLVLYGPFKRQGRHTARSNEAFDASLKARDVDWGVRDLEHEVLPAAEEAGFRLDDVVTMPANNFCGVFVRA